MSDDDLMMASASLFLDRSWPARINIVLGI